MTAVALLWVGEFAAPFGPLARRPRDLFSKRFVEYLANLRIEIFSCHSARFARLVNRGGCTFHGS